MKDIPVFSCPDGIATLILREVPFRGEGYILVRGVFGTLEQEFGIEWTDDDLQGIRTVGDLTAFVENQE